jgi:hypothetical protein
MSRTDSTAEVAVKNHSAEKVHKRVRPALMAMLREEADEEGLTVSQYVERLTAAEDEWRGAAGGQDD